MITGYRISILPAPACFGVIRTQTTYRRGVEFNSRPLVVQSQDDSKQDERLEDMGSTNQGPKDFWEGEQWNFLGEISSIALPIFVVLGLLVGIFAAQTYNQDADVFLDSPKSAEESAKLYKFE